MSVHDKGIGYFFPPNVRERFGPLVRGATQLFKPTPYTPTAAKDLLTSTANISRGGILPFVDATGRFLTTGVTQALEANPAFRPVVKGAKFASNLAQEAIESATKKTASEGFLKATKTNTALNRALREIGEDKVSQMTTPDLLKLLEKDYGVKVGFEAISRKKITKPMLNFPSKKSQKIKKKDQISQSFENIAERLKKIDFEKLDTSSDEVFKIINEERIKQGLPELTIAAGKTPDSSVVVKKLLDRDFIDKKTFDKIKDYGQRRYEIGVKRGRETAITTAKLNTKKQSDKAMELINKLQAEQDDPLLMTNEIFVNKLKDFAPDLFKKSYYTTKGTRGSLIKGLAEYNPEIKNFLAQPKQVNPETLTFALKKKREPRFQTQYNPALQERLEYIKNIDEVYGDTLGGKSLRIIKAHALGEGRVKDLKAKDIVALEKKIKYIPEKNLDEVKNPSYFLTYSGNIKHRNIENALVNALVDKYQKLGYKFVDDAEMPWKKPDKEIDLSLSKNKELANEIKALNKKIDGFRNDLFKMDAYTLFYNPIKDKMVSYGKDISELPGLANIVTRVKKGDLELRDGGIISIEEMINRPIYERY
tara:strand:- start:43 stop:1818 length:1776 start_codon:yes stop_codon:yes gene_type:complete